MNLVVIVDRGFRGEVENRLARVGRYHPSRLVIAAVEEGRTQLDAWATVAAEDAVHKPGHIAVGRERVEVDIGPQHLESLDTIVDPLLVPDLDDDGVGAARPRRGRRGAAPAREHRAHRHAGRPAGPGGVRARRRPDALGLRRRPRVAALDAVARARRGDVRPAARCAARSARSTRSSCATAATRPPPACCSAAGSRRGWAGARRRSRSAATTLTGPRPRAPRRGHARAAAGGDGRARARRRHDRDGLGRVGLARPRARAACAPCGARATASEQAWTVLGASRGEAGILGEGVRQALLRDPTYKPALEAGRVLVG